MSQDGGAYQVTTSPLRWLVKLRLESIGWSWACDASPTRLGNDTRDRGIDKY
jgi:hypothetical protein